MKEALLSLLLVLVLVCPLSPAAAQGPVGGALSSPKRSPPWERDGRSPEVRPWGPPGATRRAEMEMAHLAFLNWHIETVDSTSDVGHYISLALDSSGRPHISYYEDTAFNDGNLKYAHYDGTAWITETVDSAGDVGKWSSLALDANDHPHISYCSYDSSRRRNTCYALKYTHYDGTAWQIEVVDGEIYVGKYTSLALDNAGRPHISYCLTGPWGDCWDLRYAYYDGTSWQVDTVEDAPAVGYHTSLALDAAGRPHISYYDGHLNNDLKYAHYNGTSWITETVDSEGDVGAFTSLALDASNRPHISYFDNTNADLKYAHYGGTTWQIQTVDSKGYVGSYTSLALDVAGRPHISYGADSGLKYAHYDGTSWISETVDSQGDVGYFTSLALDAANRPHIGYGDHTNEDLKYAHAICVGVEQVTVDGLDQLPMGMNSLYTATYEPLTASLPLTFTWDNGTTGATATYSWTVTGTYTLHVTATNECGEAQDSLTVTVFCQAVEGVEVSGPLALLVDQVGTYRAAPQPITASLPLTFTWDSGAVGDTATYSWPATGTYTLAVTATNVCGGVQTTSLQVEVLTEWSYSVYLPLMLREW